MLVWLNGTFVDKDEARISLFDAGFQHAVGLFETMHVRNGRVFRGPSHMERMGDAARALRLSERLRAAALLEAVELTVARNELAAARVRLTITGGDLNVAAGVERTGQDPTIAIVAQPPTPYPDAFFEQGVRVVVADGRLNPLDPLAGRKTLSYWPRLLALQGAAGKSAGEAVWFSVSNHLASGSVSNVFLVKDDVVRTPLARGEEPSGALTAPVLPGITRGVVRELAADLGLAADTAMLDIGDLLGADEVFLTNSSWGVLPVVAVEREEIAGGEVGPITRRLRAAWLEAVEEETSADG